MVNTSHLDTTQNLINLVDFVDEDDVEKIIERANYWLTNPNKFTERKKEIYQYSSRNQTQFDVFFNRALLALDIISFEDYYTTTKDYFCFDSNFWCLGLPESIERQNLFLDQKSKISQQINLFPGVRHLTPWLGCGMSYKYMLQFAQEKNLPHVLICEDDVIFTDTFIENLEQIQNFLNNTQINWQIFSGHITDLSSNAKIQKLTTINSLNLIQLNKTTGMVFNIYHQSSYNLFKNWNEKDCNIKTNTIDRYIENQQCLNIISTLPYLVEHNEQIETTLWNRKISKESDYSNLVKNSQEVIQKKLNS